MDEKSKSPLNKENEEIKESSLFSKFKEGFRIDKKMLAIKFANGFSFAGIYSFFPYLTLHMQVLGIGMDKIAITYAVLPFASFLGPIISGILADKLGRYTLILCCNLALTGILHTLLIMVPHNRVDTIEFHCDSWNHSLSWTKCSQDFLQYDIPGGFFLQDCNYNCANNNESHFDFCFSRIGENLTFCTTRYDNEEVFIQGIISAKVEDQSCTHFLSNIQYDQTPFDFISCPNECQITCQVNAKSANNPSLETTSDVTFYIYLFFRVVATMCLASSFSMLDAVLLAKVRETKSDFGRQRVISLLGQAFAPLITGLLVDAFNSGNGVIDYSPTLYFGDACLLISILILLTMDLNVEPVKDDILKNVGKLLVRLEIDAFLLIIILLGTLWGFLETYLFLYLDDLKAPTYMLGLTLLVGCASGVPAMFFSDYIVKKIGRNIVFLLSFVAYFVRFIGYSYITDPWYCFPFELLEIITYQILWVAAATYFPILAPKELLATMTGIGGAAHYSLGRGLGSFIGGFFIKWYGLRYTFRGFGYVALGGAAFYVLIHQFVMKKRIQYREQILKLVELQNLNSEKGQDKINMDEIIHTSRRTSIA